MLLIPSVPVPLREGSISPGLLLPLALGVILYHRMWSRRLWIQLSLCCGVEGQEAPGLLGLLGGVRRLLLQVLLVQAGQPGMG